MRRRLAIDHLIRIASALALLVSVMISPIRPNVGSTLSHSNPLRRNFGIPGKAPANHRPHVPTTARVVQVKALSSESKLDCVEYGTFLHLDLPRLASRVIESAWDSASFHLDRTSFAPRC